ncbi:ADP-ribose pyrophosphatase [Micrococcus luteus]|uniref:8-oxo-dGTP pyrophosphatase MutT (NUDIX family) n=1 Tax=Micrococcus aloeverae TaxID=1391911 RepID=A0ABR6E1L7_9MICC|nr:MULTISPECIES: NUDIX domain-containing protein [Micrococcus]EZP43535.1 ADP-ribose pyrophosphatase [Micrococcus luteus]MBA9082158.1 8-oxo-dGTP pyrophosphatase MutT (NUDIX family) [Micrococcus aloeverae]
MADHSFALVPASYVLLLRGPEVLLQRRQNTGYMDGFWVAGAAGHVEPGETARQAAVREAREELGVDVGAGDLELVTVMQRTDGAGLPREQRVDWFWTCREWAGEPQICEPEKTSDLRWFPLTGLPDPMPGYERIVLAGLGNSSLPLDTAYGFIDRTAR